MTDKYLFYDPEDEMYISGISEGRAIRSRRQWESFDTKEEALEAFPEYEEHELIIMTSAEAEKLYQDKEAKSMLDDHIELKRLKRETLKLEPCGKCENKPVKVRIDQSTMFAADTYRIKCLHCGASVTEIDFEAHIALAGALTRWNKGDFDDDHIRGLQR